MTVPIIGQRIFVCVGCGEPVRKTEIGSALVCMTDKCARFGLLTIIAKDPILEAQQIEEEQRKKEEGGGDAG